VYPEVDSRGWNQSDGRETPHGDRPLLESEELSEAAVRALPKRNQRTEEETGVGRWTW